MFLNLKTVISNDSSFRDDNVYAQADTFPNLPYNINIVEILVKIYLHNLEGYINSKFT